MVSYVKGDEQSPKLSANEQIVRTARDRLAESWQHEQENRRDAASDLAFLAGDQWPDQVRRQREEEGRPMITVNRLPQFIRQVTNDIRQSDLAIKVMGVDGKADEKMAEIYNGLLRQIQYRSSADHVFSMAAEHQCACGIGHFRILTDYVDDSAFDQELLIKLVNHPLSVYWDPAAVEPDRSDAMWCLVTEMVPTETFRARYPKASEESMDVSNDISESRLFWSTSDAVRVAEYWVKEPYEKIIGLTAEGESIDLTDFTDEQRSFLPPIIKERKQTAYCVRQYLVTGADVLEGPNEWAGKHIPIVPVIGSEIPLEQKTYRYGIVRFARDSQQMYNFYTTSVSEWIGQAPKSPYLVTTKMVSGGVKPLWDTAGKKQRPYLPYNPDPDQPGGPQRLHPPEMPAGLIALGSIASDDMKATTGIYDAALGAKSNETSGRAIMARDQAVDVANYHYSDNLKRSLEHAGRILIDLIPKIYDNERVVRLLAPDDKEEFVPINKVIMDVDGSPVITNDISAAKFDVRVVIGPTYTSKRQEARESLIELIQAIPQIGEVGADLLAGNLDFEGADDLRKRLRNMIPPEVLADPDDPESQPPPPPDPMEDPGIRAELEEKIAKARKAMAEARKVELETFMMYQTPMLQPEPPLNGAELLMGDNGNEQPDDMGDMQEQLPPEMMGEMGEMPPEMMQEMVPPQMSLPPGPAEELPPGFGGEFADYPALQ